MTAIGIFAVTLFVATIAFSILARCFRLFVQYVVPYLGVVALFTIPLFIVLSVGVFVYVVIARKDIWDPIRKDLTFLWRGNK
jgi:hypothetical protein